MPEFCFAVTGMNKVCHKSGLVEIPHLPGCMPYGETPEGAIDNLKLRDRPLKCHKFIVFNLSYLVYILSYILILQDYMAVFCYVLQNGSLDISVLNLPSD